MKTISADYIEIANAVKSARIAPVYLGALAVLQPDSIAADYKGKIPDLLQCQSAAGRIYDQLVLMSGHEMENAIATFKEHMQTQGFTNWKTTPSAPGSIKPLTDSILKRTEVSVQAHALQIKLGIVLGLYLYAQKHDRPFTDIIDEAIASDKITPTRAKHPRINMAGAVLSVY